MNTEQFYSLKEMAKELETTWQSIRSWKEQYYQFVPMETAGKQAWFRPEAIEIFRFIKEAKEKGMDHHDIRAELFKLSGQVDTGEEQEHLAPQVDMVMVEPQLLEEMQETIQALQKEVQELKAKWTEVEVAKRDQLLMENLRDMRDKKKKGLWSRVMNFTL